MTGNGALIAWGDTLRGKIPKECPKCDSELRQVLFEEVDTEDTIVLTGRTLGYTYMYAKCPSCKQVLVKQRSGLTRSGI